MARMMNDHTKRLLGLSLLGLAACMGPTEDVSAARAAVHGGTPSDRDAIGVLVGTGSSSTCVGAGVFLSPRHFLVSDCRDAEVLNVAVPDGSGSPSIHSPVVTVHESPSGIMSRLGEVGVQILVTAEEMPVGSAELAASGPSVDDVLVIAGFGASTGTSLATPTEGPVRVVGIIEEGAGFTFEGVDEVRPCDADSPLFDDSGDLVGLTVLGSLDPEVAGCYGISTAMSLAPLAAFVDEVLAMPVPDAVDAGAADGSVSDGGVEDGGTGDDTGADSGGSEISDDGGGGCVSAGGSPWHGGAWLALLALVGVVSRRTRS